MRHWFEDQLEHPNPVWVRELRQSARLHRTPLILALITSMMALLICSVGGSVSVTLEPAKVGVALFHTFFSVAFALVSWLGPAVASSSIASERSNRTWEALLLTGLTPARIARGKFFSALTYIGLYLVTLAPVGALPFLFGGVTPTEVIIAFVLMALVAALSVAFGLAMSSKLSSPAVAIIVTLVLAIPGSMFLFLLLGPALSISVHELWPSVDAGPPIWLPAAYVRADFGVEYLVLLVLGPLVATVIPGWLLFEVTVSNMSDPSADRSSGVRRWFLVSAPAITATLAAFVAVIPGRSGPTVAAVTLFCFLVTVAFLFMGEPLWPSRRVVETWQHTQARMLKSEIWWSRSSIRRFLGPGILQASSLLLVLGLSVIGLLVTCLLAMRLPPIRIRQVLAVNGYLAGFFVFVVGLGAWVRSRAHSSVGPRMLMIAALFSITVGPWIAMAIAGVVSQTDKAVLVAAPSPTFALVMSDALTTHAAGWQERISAGAMAAGGWTVFGAFLLGAARVRVRRLHSDHQRSLAELEALL
ncbi:MAG TPA: ABC transporter permease, partial [Polyangiaceae bacterium]